MVEKIKSDLNIPRLQELFAAAWEDVAWTPCYPTSQSGLHVCDERPDDYLLSCSLKSEPFDEKKFTKLHPRYQNSYVEEVLQAIPLRIYRMRWMILFGKACYTLHSDGSRRLHIPVISNENSYIIFKEPASFQQLTVGNAYLVDTTRVHTAINGDTDFRVHLVGCVDEKL